MGFTVIRVILAISIIFQCYGVNSEKRDAKIVSGPTKIEPKSEPVATASFMIQQVTHSIHYVGQIYYYQRKGELLYPNREMNGSIYAWYQNNGTIKRHYFKKLSKEIPATVIPVAENTHSLIIGSNQSLRLCTKNDTDYTLSEPLIHFNDNGFIIYSAHCDTNGIMFILLIGHTKETEHLGKLYKITNKKAEHVKDFSTKPRDFRFNQEYTLMYIIHDNGKKIDAYKYDLKTAVLGNATNVFDKAKYPDLKEHIMTSVVADRNVGNLWVTAAGKEGYVLEINPSKKEIVTIITVPTKDLTFLTFGYNKYETLFVGSKRTCAKGKVQGSIYAVSGMGVQGVADKPIKW